MDDGSRHDFFAYRRGKNKNEISWPAGVGGKKKKKEKSTDFQ